METKVLEERINNIKEDVATIFKLLERDRDKSCALQDKHIEILAKLQQNIATINRLLWLVGGAVLTLIVKLFIGF